MQRANLGDPKKGAPVLLATSPTLDGIKKHIARFYASTPEAINIEGERITNGSTVIKSCRVIPWRGGYRFEAVEPKQ